MKTKKKLKLVAALIVIATGAGCWWWLSFEGYTKPAQRVIIVQEN